MMEKRKGRGNNIQQGEKASAECVRQEEERNRSPLLWTQDRRQARVLRDEVPGG